MRGASTGRTVARICLHVQGGRGAGHSICHSDTLLLLVCLPHRGPGLDDLSFAARHRHRSVADTAGADRRLPGSSRRPRWLSDGAPSRPGNAITRPTRLRPLEPSYQSANRPPGASAKSCRASMDRRRATSPALATSRPTRLFPVDEPVKQYDGSDRNQPAHVAASELFPRATPGSATTTTAKWPPATGMTLSSGSWFNRGCWYSKEEAIYLDAVRARPASSEFWQLEFDPTIVTAGSAALPTAPFPHDSFTEIQLGRNHFHCSTTFTTVANPFSDQSAASVRPATTCPSILAWDLLPVHA